MPFLWLWALPIGLAVLAFTLAVHGAHLHGRGHPSPHVHLLRKGHHHLGVALACGIIAGVIAGAATAAGYGLLYGPHGLLEPPEPAQQAHGLPGGGARPRGLLVRPGRAGAVRTYSARPLPAAVDLSGWAPPVGDQGRLNSCASWAVGYGLRTWYANRAGRRLAGGGAPMYLYSQATGGRNIGTTIPAVLTILLRQGIDARQQYRQGDYDYIHRPTLAERWRALRWRIGGWRTLFLGQNQGGYARAALEQALAGGNPVVLGIPVYDNFMAADRSHYYISGRPGNDWGGHAVLALKYDANGVWVQNEWGTGWGLFGWAEISWSFIERYALEADVMKMRRSP